MSQLFQSLLSQGISLLQNANEGFAERLSEFQSLLSQGISLLPKVAVDNDTEIVGGFNPFLVRASVYCMERLLLWNCTRLFCFNPFLVRASVYWSSFVGSGSRLSWPFQSLLSQGISLLRVVGRALHPPIGHGFQSLLSQGISLLPEELPRNGFETAQFQSLLSQGISLLQL